MIVGVVILSEHPLDPDFGWHLKYGEYIWQTKSILRENIFSYTLPDHTWANSYWLSQVYIYLLYSKTGALGLTLINSLIINILIQALFLKKVSHTNNFLLTIVINTIFSIYSITVRPLFFSTIFLIILYKELRNDSLKWLPVIFLFWANIHADFVIGLGILLIYAILAFAKSKNNYLILIFVISAIATLANPYGINLWKSLFYEVVHHHPLQPSYIEEFAEVTKVKSLVEGITYLIVISTAILFALKEKNRQRVYLMITIVFFYLLSLKAEYYSRHLLVAVIPLIITAVNEYSLTGRLLKYRKIIKTYLFIIAIVVFATLVETKSAIGINKGTVLSKHYPIQAIEFIKEKKLNGNMLNNYDWGGFLIWQLSDYKTFIDGRMPSWNYANSKKRLFEDYIRITYRPYQNIQLIDAIVTEYNIQFALLSVDQPLANFLIKEENWEVAYVDTVSVVLINPYE